MCYLSGSIRPATDLLMCHNTISKVKHLFLLSTSILTPSGFFVTCSFALSFSFFRIPNAEFGHIHCNPNGVGGENSGLGTDFSPYSFICH
jgi:hypothetical protein